MQIWSHCCLMKPFTAIGFGNKVNALLECFDNLYGKVEIYTECINHVGLSLIC